MTVHFFDTEVAAQYGVEEAIILQHLYFWTEKKLANNQIADDGLVYIYNSVRAWRKLFPYISERTMRRCLARLEDANIIVSRKDLNSTPYDRTKHYAITKFGFSTWPKRQINSDETSNQSVRNVEPIPDSKPDSKPDSNGSTGVDRFAEFWETYPRKVGKKPSREKWKQKKLDCYAEQIIADVKTRTKSHKPWLKGFVPNPSTYLTQERWEDELETENTESLGEYI